MIERVIARGKITDLETGREYILNGVKVRNNLIYGGSGYCLTIRDVEGMTRYILSLVTDESYSGSVANCSVVHIAAVLKDFVYEGVEEL